MASVTNHCGDASEALRSAMAAAGLEYHGTIYTDGKLHRFKSAGDSDEDSWYVLHGDGVPAGAFGCWKRGFTETWRLSGKWTPEQIREAQERQRAAIEKRKLTEIEAANEAREKAEYILGNSSPVTGHSYLEAKGVRARGGMRLYKGTLALPLIDTEGTIHSLQFIGHEGTKRFLSGGRVSGVFYQIGEDGTGPLVICEGAATGLSIHEATGTGVVCAMNAGNLLPVAKAIRVKYPQRQITIAADNDAATKNNPGVTKATEAAKAIRARLAIVSTDEGTDFNDLHKAAGLDEVRRQIESAESTAPEAKPFSALRFHLEQDPNELIKSRWLCSGGAALLVAPTGIGKSVLLTQTLFSWALGRECFGLVPTNPLTAVLIQAENDDGDLAEMRDGVIYGLGLTPTEAALATSRVFVDTVDSKTGPAFTAHLDALLEHHKPRIVAIDPALAYLGGDAMSQKDVGGFLRNLINPVLHRHNCACILVHHTNKPATGNEKGEWKAGDFAYLGSGSAEWANWARAVLAVRSLGSNSVYELRAGKRGARLGWKDEDGGTSYARLIGHSLEPGRIYWRDASESELQPKGRPKSYSADDLLSILPAGGLSTTEWKELAAQEYGIKERRFYDLLKEISTEERALKSKISHKWQPIMKKAA